MILKFVGVSNFLPHAVEVGTLRLMAINGFISGSNQVSHFSHDQKVLNSSFSALEQNKHSHRCQHLVTGSICVNAILILFGKGPLFHSRFSLSN